MDDLQGNEVARVHRRLVALMATYEIDFPDVPGPTEVHRRFSNPLRPKWTISQPGQPDLTMTGNFFGHDFSIEKDGQEVASVSKKWVSLTDSYGVDIADGQNDLLILCGVLALEAEQARRAAVTDGVWPGSGGPHLNGATPAPYAEPGQRWNRLGPAPGIPVAAQLTTSSKWAPWQGQMKL